MSPMPWTPEHRARIKQRIDMQANLCAKRLHASYVLMIAFFDDGEHTHMQEGGKSPMSVEQVYQALLTARIALAESGGKDVSVS